MVPWPRISALEGTIHTSAPALRWSSVDFDSRPNIVPSAKLAKTTGKTTPRSVPARRSFEWNIIATPSRATMARRLRPRARRVGVGLTG
jgi:hypothetical protein